MDELDFTSLKPIQVPVTIPDGGGKPVKYLLCEATAGAAKRWRNAAAQIAKFTMDGVKGEPRITGMGAVADLEVILVGECLFRLDADGRRLNSPVGQSFAESLSSQITKRLYAKAIEISPALKENDAKLEADAKN